MGSQTSIKITQEELNDLMEEGQLPQGSKLCCECSATGYLGNHEDGYETCSSCHGAGYVRG